MTRSRSRYGTRRDNLSGEGENISGRLIWNKEFRVVFSTERRLFETRLRAVIATDAVPPKRKNTHCAGRSCFLRTRRREDGGESRTGCRRGLTSTPVAATMSTDDKSRRGRVIDRTPTGARHVKWRTPSFKSNLYTHYNNNTIQRRPTATCA